MPAWTSTPKTWAAGDKLTAALLNAQLRDPLAALGGQWVAYTPTISNFNPGNGTVAGGYCQFGKLVHFWATLTFGSTSAAAAGACGISLPLPAARVSVNNLYGMLVDASPANEYAAIARLASTGVVGLFASGANGLRTYLTTAVPFTWAVSDSVYAAGTYEAA